MPFAVDRLFRLAGIGARPLSTRAGAPTSTGHALATVCRPVVAGMACLACGCGGGTRGTDDGADATPGAYRSPDAPLSMAIARIQGRDGASPYAGLDVVTRGVVTRLADGGFFIQDPACDRAAGASCGLYVHRDAAAAVPGHAVEVEGRVSEFDPSRGTVPGGATLTEITRVRRVVDLGPGAVVVPVIVPWPPASAQALARLEGMLVTIPGPFTVQQNVFLGRFGNVTLGSGGRIMSPAEQVARGAAARELATRNVRRSLLLDDGRATQDPNPVPWLGPDGTLRAGDQVADVTGVLDIGRASGSRPASGIDPVLPRLRPTVAPVFVRSNPRPAAPGPVGGDFRVASANLDNAFLTPADGHGRCAPSRTPADCRGARNVAELARQEAKLVEELAGLDADVVGLQEVQNDGGATLRHLVDGLNARLRAPAYASVPDPDTGLGMDAIRVALIYRPARLRLAGSSASDTAAVHSRAPLAQFFESVDGEDRFGVIVSHFKSKDCTDAQGDDRDAGDGQGCWGARRMAQAQALSAFAAALQRRAGIDDVLLVGDFNACSQEDALRRLRDAGWVDETARLAPGAYSYVFDGAACQLDHVFASPGLSGRVAGATDWHINADEPAVLDYTLSFRQPACRRCAPDGYTASPWRASDHDPVLVGIASTTARAVGRLGPSDRHGAGLAPSWSSRNSTP